MKTTDSGCAVSIDELKHDHQTQEDYFADLFEGRRIVASTNVKERTIPLKGKGKHDEL